MVYLWCGDFNRTSRLPLMWSASLSVALANFVAWSPLKVQRNINSLYRNPTLHKSIKLVMARQTSLQMTTPELPLFLLLRLSCPQTILTVFGHSIWLRNGSTKSTVFRSAIEHTTRNNKYRSNSQMPFSSSDSITLAASVYQWRNKFECIILQMLIS